MTPTEERAVPHSPRGRWRSAMRAVPMLLVFSAALSATDWNEIPLSDRPSAPLQGIANVTASRAGDLVLALYSGSSVRDPAHTQQWIERFTIDGFRADAGAANSGQEPTFSWMRMKRASWRLSI